MPRDDDTWFEDDELTREGGVFVSRGGGHGVGARDEEAPPDDWVEDPTHDGGVPGTVDDLPYDYGVETPLAADETFEGTESPTRGWDVGRTGRPDEGDETPLGMPEERELWRLQRPLIEEVEAQEQRYAGLNEPDIREIVEVSGEDSGEPLPEAPDGVSATGHAAKE